MSGDESKSRKAEGVQGKDKHGFTGHCREGLPVRQRFGNEPPEGDAAERSKKKRRQAAQMDRVYVYPTVGVDSHDLHSQAGWQEEPAPERFDGHQVEGTLPTRMARPIKHHSDTGRFDAPR